MRNSPTITQPATDITRESMPSNDNTKLIAAKIKSEMATDLRAPSSVMLPANQPTKPGTISAAPISCATKLRVALKFTVVPTLKPNRPSTVLGANKNPAAKMNKTTALRMNK